MDFFLQDVNNFSAKDEGHVSAFSLIFLISFTRSSKALMPEQENMIPSKSLLFDTFMISSSSAPIRILIEYPLRQLIAEPRSKCMVFALYTIRKRPPPVHYRDDCPKHRPDLEAKLECAPPQGSPGRKTLVFHPPPQQTGHVRKAAINKKVARDSRLSAAITSDCT